MNDFFYNSFFKKKAVYSQTTFALLLILYFSLMIFAYFYYEQGVEDYTKLQIENSQLELFSLIQQDVFRSVVLENQTVLLDNDFTLENTEIILNMTFIKFITLENSFKVENNYSFQGISFCNTYTLYLELSNVLTYNGSCISIITS